MQEADTTAGTRRAWLAVNRVPGLAGRPLAALRTLGFRPEQILALRRAPAGIALSPGLLAALASPDWTGVDADCRWLDGPGRSLISLDDSRYPARLREIAAPPAVLFVAGDPAVLDAPQIAVVGSRRPSADGLASARELAAGLAGGGLVVTSGLARGIDAVAHAAAIEAGGRTIAVLGTGPDRVYPASNARLAERIVAGGGALVTEFPAGTAPRAEHFPRRNRIVSGLALGTLVVEAGLPSGSLSTARHALDQGREVFAVPGSVHNPLSRGCHALIREGAMLVESVEDVLVQIGAQIEPASRASARTHASAHAHARDPRVREVYDALGHAATSLDTLVERTGLTAQEVSSILVALEIDGCVRSQPGGLYERRPTTATT